MNDIVYILKNGKGTDEIKYSLRSLVNFPHGNVWIYGGHPEGIRADRQVSVLQRGVTKWQKVRNTLVMVCQNDEITEDFWLFNDDFFCMKDCEDLPPIYHGSIKERIREIRDRHGTSEYMLKLLQTEGILDKSGLPIRNYAVHMPMLVNRQKALEVLNTFDRCPMFRCLYGNYFDIGGENRADVKIYRMDEEPDHDATWLSTTNDSFKYGAVGRYIREELNEASEYEIG